jgi:hypothetical protein
MKGQYSHHALPTGGARPVPANDEGKREKAGWGFHYKKGWLNPANSKFKSGATYKNPFPDSQKGDLDYDLLKHMGLNKVRLEKHDTFFFWQLLFPICNPAESGIPDNPRMPFYSNLEAWSQKYAAHMGIGGSYGHDYKQVMATELLHFDMAVRTKEHGRNKTKVKWAIKMNEACQLYLASYSWIDTIDLLIKNCNMFSVSWKYWHASKLHVQGLAVVVAYNMYKKIIEEAWSEFGFETKQEAVKKCMFLDFHAFRDQLVMQRLRYNPEDMAMMFNTKRKKGPLREGEKRAVGQPRKNVTPDGDDDEGVVAAGGAQVTLAQFNQLKKPITGPLCGNLDKYMFHRQNIETIKHRLT